MCVFAYNFKPPVSVKLIRVCVYVCICVCVCIDS